MSPGGHRTVDFALLVEVAAAATIGGVVAAVVLAFDDGELRLGLVAFLIVMDIVLAVLIVATLQLTGTERTRGPIRSTPTRETFSYPPQADPWPTRPPEFVEDTPGPPKLGFRPAAPIDITPQARPEPDRRPPRTEEHPVPGARRGVKPVRRVVQCPHCGDFDVDLKRDRESFSFTCRRCQTRWSWSPGHPWPTTVVRPSATGPV